MAGAFLKKMSVGVVLLVLILAAEYYTDFDLWVQKWFYVAETGQWAVNSEVHKRLGRFFYQGPKVFYGIVCLGLVLYLLLSWRAAALRRYNRQVWVLLLSLILVPLIVAGAKYFTNVYCPYQLNLYNGEYPFVRIVEAYPADFVQLKSGRCFPAGHATVGFAFMALYFCFQRQVWRWCGLFFGLALGWTAAVYQMYRGQHFLSHSLFSMVACFMVIMMVDYAVNRFYGGEK